MSEEEKFTEAIKAHEGIIYKITTVYAKHEEDRQDLYQEIVAQLWSSFPQFRNDAKISTWMYRIALNTAISGLRKSKKRQEYVSIDQAVLTHIEVTDPLKEERIKALYEHIEMLSDLDKAIMILYLDEKAHDEIAGIVGISKSNVGTRISRIREKLKQGMVNAG